MKVENNKEREDFNNWLAKKPDVSVEAYYKLNPVLQQEVYQVYLKEKNQDL